LPPGIFFKIIIISVYTYYYIYALLFIAGNFSDPCLYDTGSFKMEDGKLINKRRGLFFLNDDVSMIESRDA